MRYVQIYMLHGHCITLGLHDQQINVHSFHVISLILQRRLDCALRAKLHS